MSNQLDITIKHLKPGVLEFSGPELLMRMIEHEFGFHRPEGKPVMDCIAEIEGMAKKAGPDIVAVLETLKQLTGLCNDYFAEVVDRAALPQQ